LADPQSYLKLQIVPTDSIDVYPWRWHTWGQFKLHDAPEILWSDITNLLCIWKNGWMTKKMFDDMKIRALNI